MRWFKRMMHAESGKRSVNWRKRGRCTIEGGNESTEVGHSSSSRTSRFVILPKAINICSNEGRPLSPRRLGTYTMREVRLFRADEAQGM
ncbi:hypothetical protein WG66_015991, partial [Moniliophthora roreri]